jgi:hypothetical protein
MSKTTTLCDYRGCEEPAEFVFHNDDMQRRYACRKHAELYQQVCDGVGLSSRLRPLSEEFPRTQSDTEMGGAGTNELSDRHADAGLGK